MLILDGQYAAWCRLAAFSYASCLVCHRIADERSSVGLVRTRIAEFIVIVNEFVMHKRPTVETWSLTVEETYTVIPRLTSEPANEFFG